ncbi:MAG: polyprenyl diphosphate synthase [Candidatus Thermoplasmatota archaeon]|nr:polyprenyl diphosphate synthase [Candidatus Thermoplasmatota archaeon]MCL5963924.1 polyprenyl diphosphate synthase [Candidatus Thermoplasmatota archaeon]
MTKDDILKFVKNTTYNAYETTLLKKVKSGIIPKHMAIIMDGNRRFAERMEISVEEGHIRGKDKLEEVLNWCLELDIKILTVYAFSTENFKRSKLEVEHLMKMFIDNFKQIGDDKRVHKYKIRVKIIGRIDSLPEDVVDAIKYAEEKTANYSEYLYNIAVAYGGREEIIQAIRSIATEVKDNKLEVKDIDESVVKNHLYTSDLPDPDIILRTSGEERISNFLLWQMAYSELYFVDVFWPELSKLDFLRAIYTYQQRKRKYGV